MALVQNGYNLNNMNWLREKAIVFLNSLHRLPTRVKNGYQQFYSKALDRWEWVHRKVAEIASGAKIPAGHEVHHVNREKLDNNPENLEILTKEEHRELHRKERSRRIKSINEKLKNINETKDFYLATQKVNSIDSLNQLLNIKKTTFNFMENEFAKPRYHSNQCSRCSGTGYLPHFSHVAGGVCFSCNGSRIADEESFDDHFSREEGWEDYQYDTHEAPDDYGDYDEPGDYGNYDEPDDYGNYDEPDDYGNYNDYDNSYY